MQRIIGSGVLEKNLVNVGLVREISIDEMQMAINVIKIGEPVGPEYPINRSTKVIAR